MARRPAVLRIDPTLSSLSSDDTANPFESPRALSAAESLSKPAPAVLGRQDYIARTRRDTLVSQEQVFDEKDWLRHSQQKSVDRKSSPRHTHDPEKTVRSPHSSYPVYCIEAPSIARSTGSASDATLVQEPKALKILLYLSGPCVLLSFLTFFWAIMSLLVTILCQPLRLCTPRVLFRTQLSHLLAPTLNLHLRCIHAAVYGRPTEGEEIYSASWLLLVHLAGPILSLGNAIAAWVVAIYWGLARIVGDPNGNDKKDDGVEAVLGLAGWWERLLVKCVKS